MDSKKRNIIVVNDYAYINGGTATVAIESAIALCNTESFSVHFFAAVGPVCSELLNNSNIQVFCCGIEDINNNNPIKSVVSGIWNLKVFSIFTKYLSQFDPATTVIHFHGWTKALSSAAIYAAKLKKMKTIITLHDYFPVCANGGLYNYRTNERCSIKPSSIKCFFCNCDKRNYLQKLWRSLRQVVQNRVVKNNSSIFFISISSLSERIMRNDLKSTYFYRINDPIDLRVEKHSFIHEKIFLYLGRLSNEKNASLFCEAIRQLRENGSQVKGVVVGAGPQYEELYSRYNRDVSFVGWKEKNETLQYIRNARAVVFPSKWYETAGLVVLEAMALGCPCIVSDCTATVEWISDNKTGLLFRSNDIDSLKSRITEIMDDEVYLELLDGIHSYMNSHDFGMAKHVSSLIGVYSSVLGPE